MSGGPGENGVFKGLISKPSLQGGTELFQMGKEGKDVT